nr:MAG TPA: tail protein-type pyocin [Caudoviricetes sp.]
MTKFLSEEGLRYFYNQIKSKFAPASHNHSAGNITSGTLPITRGGTGQTTAAGVRNALGLGNTTGAVPVANGGTGATNVAAAIKALFGTSAIGSSTKPLYYDGATLKACADSIGGGGIVAALLEQNGYVKFANGLILQLENILIILRQVATNTAIFIIKL